MDFDWLFKFFSNSQITLVVYSGIHMSSPFQLTIVSYIAERLIIQLIFMLYISFYPIQASLSFVMSHKNM